MNCGNNENCDGCEYEFGSPGCISGEVSLDARCPRCGYFGTEEEFWNVYQSIDDTAVCPSCDMALPIKALRAYSTERINALESSSKLQWYEHHFPLYNEEWIDVKVKLPEPDVSVIVCVKNKNKENGIYLYDVCSHDGERWGKRVNTWEDIIFWMKPKGPFVERGEGLWK